MAKKEKTISEGFDEIKELIDKKVDEVFAKHPGIESKKKMLFQKVDVLKGFIENHLDDSKNPFINLHKERTERFEKRAAEMDEKLKRFKSKV